MIHSFKEPRELDWVRSAAGSRKRLICESHMEVGVSAKRCDWERTYGRDALQPPLQEVFRLHSLQAFAPEMKGRWSHRRSLSIYQRHRLSAGDTFGDSWEVLAPEGIPSLSSEWIDLSTVWTRGSLGPWSSLKGVLLHWSMRSVCVEGICPLTFLLFQFHLCMNITVCRIPINIHPIILHPAFIHSSY